MSDHTIVISLDSSPKKMTLDLSKAQRAELENALKHHSKPYMREKAAALLKVADGWSAKDTARYGLLQSRRPNTVRNWVRQYREDGFEQLEVSEGRGRKPAFSP